MALMGWLKQSTAVTVTIGPFVDDTDGKTAETALTLSQADVQLSKNDGAFAQKGETTSASHKTLGYYSCNFNTTDTGTLGLLTLAVHESGALPVRHDYLVVPANVYDSLVAGSDTLQADVTQFNGTNGTFSSGRPEVNTTHAAGTAWGSGAITAASIAANAITSAKIATDAIGSAQIAADAIGASELAASAVTEMQTAVDASLVNYDGGNGVASLSNQVTINTGVDTILLRIGAFAGSGVNTILGFLRALMRKDVSITTPSDVGGTYDHTTDSNEALRDRGDAAWTTATGFSTLDAAGVRTAVGLSSANLDTQLSTIDSVVDAVKLKTDNLPADPADASDIAAAIAALNDLAASEVWDLTDGVEAGETPRQTLRLLRAILVGLLERTAGTSATGTVEFKRKDGATVAATVDYDGGERTAVTIGTL